MEHILLLGYIILSENIAVGFTQTMTLLPLVAEVLENENITLTCSGSTNDTISAWKRSSNLGLNPMISLKDGDCIATGYFARYTDSYAWHCFGNGTFTLTLKSVERSQHGENWKCLQNNVESNVISIFVKVAIDNVKIETTASSIITLDENSIINLNCSTSYGRPAPNISWYLDKGTLTQDDDEIIVPDETFQSMSLDDDNLVSTVSEIMFSLNRSANGWGVYCSAINVQEKDAILSNSTSLNIIYPPDGPQAINALENGSTYHIIENHVGKLSCSITGGNPLASLEWSCFNSIFTSAMNDTTNTITASWTALRSHQSSCECWSEHRVTGNISLIVNVDVLYTPVSPNLNVSSVTVHGTINVITNKSLDIKCQSISNPMPVYMWDVPNSSTSRGQLLQIKRISSPENGTYYCRVKNEMHSSDGVRETGYNITSVNVNVLFPPSKPMFRYGNISGPVIQSASLVVVQNDTFTVTCSFMGNPEPEYTWNRMEKGSNVLLVSIISASIVRTCYATNFMNETVGETRKGTAEANISIIVQSPPSVPDIRFQHMEGHEIKCMSGNVSVVETTSFTLTCEAYSTPEPTYSWYGPRTSTYATLMVNNINRSQTGTYTCYAFNRMERSFGGVESGTNKNSIHLNVLYPPTTAPLNNITAVEGSQLNISCPVKAGNPTNTYVIWTRNMDNKQWLSRELTFQNARRYDDMIYTCRAYNKMEPNCEKETVGEDNKHFHLNIVYKTQVESFYIVGNANQNPVIVDEQGSAQFICNIESNPDSLISIMFGGKTLVSKYDRKKLMYTNSNMSCFDAGIYECSGNNTYNLGVQSKKYLTLHVACFPRASPKVALVDKIYTFEHVSVTFNFTAIAYPEPRQSGYKWQRQTHLGWIPLFNNKKVTIVTSGLQSNLTVENVTISDFGKYRLFVENPLGVYQQNFYLAAIARPQAPTNFGIKQGSLIDTSVTVLWKPGFDGGIQQTFTLKYREVTSNEWSNVSLLDKGYQVVNYTFQNLTSGVKYRLVLTATNVIGTSPQSSILTFQTLARPQTPTNLEVKQGSLTDTSVTVGWNPGFNGGIQQHFILKYREVTGNNWINVSVPDTGAVIANYTILNLVGGKKYQLMLLSENMFGRSLKMMVLDIQTTDSSSGISSEEPVLGLSIGLTLSAVALILTLVVVFRLRKRRIPHRRMKDIHDKNGDDQRTTRTRKDALTGKSGFELNVISSNSSAFDRQFATGQAADRKTTIYEDIVIPQGTEVVTIPQDDGYEVPVSKLHRNGKVSETKDEGQENKTSYEEITKRSDAAGTKRHTDCTDYMNLNDVK